MGKHDKLQKIKMFDYPNCGYEDVKKMHFRSFNQFFEADCTVVQSVNGHLLRLLI